MAKERVQVQGLGGAVPGISPTIQRGGQDSVQVQQAGRNKLMDLADALGQVNPMLQQYTRVADIEAEQFEEELAGKSPEEVQAMLKQTEGELDKQVRRGGMGWLTSPLNQKRKLKAVGSLMHDEYERELRSKVQDPANADADISDLINDSKNALRQKYGALDSMFVNDGFESSIRDTTQRLTLAHDAASTTQSRQDLRRAGKSVLYNASQKMEPMYNADGQLLRGEIDSNSIDNWWTENQGAFTPNELIALIEDVALTHAEEGDEDSADAWLDHATKYLTVGTAALGASEDQPLDDVFGEYGAELARMRQRVSAISESKTSKEKGDAALLKQEVDSGVTSAMLAISKGKPYEVEPDTFLTTEEEVENYFTNKLQESGNVYAMGSDGIKVIKNAINLTGEDENLIRFTQIHTQARGADVNYNALMKRSTERGIPVTIDELTGKPTTDSYMIELAADLQIEIGQRRQEKIRELSTGEYTKVNGEQVDSTKWQDVVTVDMYEWDKEFVRQYEETLKERINARQTEIKAAEKVKESNQEAISYIDPSNTLEEKTSGWFAVNNFYDLEELVKEGNFAEAKKIAAVLSEKKYLPRGRDRFETYQPLKDAFDQLSSTTLSNTEKDIARKKILLYGIATEGSNLYNVEAIKRGSINIEGTEVKIEDKQALQDLALVYPMISKTRIQEIASQQGGDVSDVLELYNALFDTAYKADEEKGKDAIKSFIEKTKSLYEK